MRTRLVLLFFAVAVAANAEVSHVKPKTLPDWWPKGLFATGSTIVAEDYAEASFPTEAKPANRVQPTVTVRGHHWHAYLVRTPQELKLKTEPDAFAKWSELKRALEAEGFHVITEEERREGIYKGVHATLRRGEGDQATWAKVEIEHPFRNGQFEAVEVAPNPFSITLTPPAAAPESFTDKQNFPYLAPPPGSRLTTTSHWKHPMTFYTGEKGHDATVIGTGFIEKFLAADPTISDLAFHDAYVTALQKAGWTVMPLGHAGFDISAVYDRNGRGIYAHITKSSFSAADVGQELAAALAKNCKASVYGINFDFDKATLRADSDPVLGQVLKVLKDDPKLDVEIGGHTDNVGKPEYNLALSERRAASVREWLVGHGIAASRLSSHGYGDTQPVVPNTTEENRAQNRRVELKKPGCK